MMRRLSLCLSPVVVFVLAFSLAGLSLHAEETYVGEPYEMHFRDAEISAALHFICSEAGLNLVMAANHRPRIAGDFDDHWDAVITRVLETNGLSYRIADTFLLVGHRGEPLLDPKLEVIHESPAERPVSLNVWNASLQDVVRFLVDKTLAHSKLDPNGPPLRGYITVQAVDVWPRQLLQLVLAANGYGFEDHSGVIKLLLLPGFELPATPDKTTQPQCESSDCDDVSNIALRGTLTPKKEGSSSVALVEFADDHYREVREGTMIGKRARIVGVKPDQVIVTDGRTGVTTDVTLRIEGVSQTKRP